MLLNNKQSTADLTKKYVAAATAEEKQSINQIKTPPPTIQSVKNDGREEEASREEARIITSSAELPAPDMTVDASERQSSSKSSSKQQPQEAYDPEVENDYHMGMSKLNASAGSEDTKDYRAAFYYLGRAASRGHTRAREEMAVASLFGDFLAPNLTAARETFEDLAAHTGSARSQFFMGFMNAAGLGVAQSSQAKALTYLTFAALGGDPMAQMALGYRYWSGVGVASSCEMSLSYYKRVATSVAATISTNSVGAVIHRIRLYDEEEKITGQSQVSVFF